MASNKASEPIFLPIAAVCSRYDHVSDMWIERRLKDDSGFPKPIYIAKRRFWRLADLELWERSLATKGANVEREMAGAA